MNEFLRARVLFLESALTEAAKSLETAAAWRQGENDDEDIWPWLRSRAMVARQALATSPPSVGQEVWTEEEIANVKKEAKELGEVLGVPCPSDAKHWDISPECAAGCQPGASPCEACRYWNYGAHCPNDATPRRVWRNKTNKSLLDQTPEELASGWEDEEAKLEASTKAMLDAVNATPMPRTQDPLPKNSTLPTLEDAGRFIAQLYDARQEDGFRRGIRYVSEMFDGWLGQHLPRPGEARQCDSCETRPASSWCNGCIIEDHQAAEISRPDNPLQKRVNMLRIALAGAINAYDGCHSTSCHVFDAGLEDDALSEEVESGNNAGCDCGATEKRDALRVVLLGDGEAPRCSETTRAEHSCDFVEMLAWLRAYATQDEQGCRDPHPLWTEAHLTEGEAAGLVDFLAGRPWRKPSPTGSEST